MTREQRVNLQSYSAIAMLICGVALTIAFAHSKTDGDAGNGIRFSAVTYGFSHHRSQRNAVHHRNC